MLCTSTLYYELDPQTLSTQFTNPLPAGDEVSLIEAQGNVYAYICNSDEPDYIKVYNTATLDYVGHVQSAFNLDYAMTNDMITLHSRNEIWCLFWNLVTGEAGAFCISD